MSRAAHFLCPRMGSQGRTRNQRQWLDRRNQRQAKLKVECQKMSHASLCRGQMAHLGGPRQDGSVSEHAIFGTLSRKTVLMEDQPLITCLWVPQKLRMLSGMGVPRTGLGVTHLLCSLQSKHGGSEQARLSLATTPIYIWPNLRPPHPPGAGHGSPPQKSPLGGVWIAQPSGHMAERVGLGDSWIWGSPPLGMEG